jgi:hypothetical protein
MKQSINRYIKDKQYKFNIIIMMNFTRVVKHKARSSKVDLFLFTLFCLFVEG